MSTQIDWREELDSSFGAGADRPPTDYLVPARAALRRRRTAMGAAALLSVVVVGGIGWALAPDADDTRGSEIASDPASPTPTTGEQTGQAVGVAVRLVSSRSNEGERLRDTVVDIDGAGLVALKGTNVLRTVDNPLGFRPPQSSIGVVAERNGQERWMLLTGTDGRSSNWLSDATHEHHATFEDWLADKVAYQVEAQQRNPAFIHVNGSVAPYANFELLEKVLAPPEAAGYGPVEASAAVKYLTPQGETSFALIFKNRDALVVDPAVLDEATMAAFLTHLQGLR